MNYRKIHNIGISLLIIGLINIYNITKYGIKIGLGEIDKILIEIKEENIKIIIYIGIIIYIILNYIPRKKEEGEKRERMEYEVILGLSIIGLIIINISNELILLYLGIEIYSLSIIILLLVKETREINKIAIIYLIISSLSSGFLLLSFGYIYRNIGINNIDMIYEIRKEINIDKYIWIIVLGIIIKIGIGPWIIRVYKNIDKRIFWYQLLIPKLIYFYMLIKLLLIIKPNNNIISILLLVISIISILFGSIGGLYQIKDNIILTYSSILNFGFLLLTLTSIYFYNISINNSIWIIFHYFFIYMLNLLSLFSSFYLFSRSSFLERFIKFSSHPFFLISFLISLLSFIGIPPFSGFLSKFYLFYSYFTYSSLLSTLLFSLFLLGTLISSFYYLKFLFPSSLLSLEGDILICKTPILPTYILSFLTLFSSFYLFYFPLFFPFFSFLFY